jgi:hypothetical protein
VPTILCYGDSNTWGCHPASGARLGRDQRWPGVLRRLLPECEIIEEGLRGRTTILDDPFEDGRNGLTYLGPGSPQVAGGFAVSAPQPRALIEA